MLRLALPDITGLDPHQITDLYSARIVNVIFEGLYQYDYLASPAKVIPNTAAAMPEITDGGRTWTIRLQKGIRFTDDPAFKGAPRELLARTTSTRSSARSTPTCASAAIPRSRRC